jgi:hypothetical protein
MASPSRGTAFSDGVRVGRISDSSYNFGRRGIFMAPIKDVDMAPLASNAANLAVAQTTTANSYLVLTAGTGVTQSAYLNTPTVVYTLDVPRNISITIGTTANIMFYVFGYDIYGVALVELFNFTNGGATTLTGNKAFASVSYVRVTAVNTNVTVGTSNKFGFPIYVSNANYVFGRYNGAYSTEAITVGNTTNPATDSTNDARGTVTLTSPDGTKRFTAFILAKDLTLTPNQQSLAGINGLPQYSRALF